MKKGYKEIKQKFLKTYRVVLQKNSDVLDFSFTRFQFISDQHQYHPHQLFFHSHRFLYRISLWLCTAFLLLLYSGCEKVIDVDLNESEPAIVIEGNLSFESGDLEVKVTKTGSYFSNEPVEKVENAAVFLENGPAFRIKAEETEKGIYKLTNLPANHNTAYRLTVIADNEEYSGVSKLNTQVKIDSLTYEYQPEQVFFDGGYRISLYYKDPPEKENYYRVKVYKNGEQFNDLNDIIVFDDKNFNGKNLRMRLRGQSFEGGDVAKVELLSIDKNAWEYFSTLREMADLNPGSPSPANPVSNLSNGALGYFSVWAVSTREIVIPEQ